MDHAQHRISAHIHKKTEQQAEQHGKCHDKPRIAANTVTPSRSHGLTYRSHGPSPQRHPKHHEKRLNLRGKTDCRLCAGINTPRHPYIGQADNHGTQHRRRLRPDKPPYDAEREGSQKTPQFKEHSNVDARSSRVSRRRMSRAAPSSPMSTSAGRRRLL